MKQKLKIQSVEHSYHDNFLDLVGKDFASDHVKGLAEWLKNSSDAYTREDVPDRDQLIYLLFDTKPARFACLDFVGMTKHDIDNAFLKWGDPNAAARGKLGKAIYGGHGNGGKFYMRQMFKSSHFITYRDGHLSVFGFDANKRYGYSKGHDGVKTSVADAIKFAGLDNYDLDKSVKERLRKGKDVRFTLVVGEQPDKLRGKNGPTYIWKRLTKHPQARRILATKPVYAIVDKLEPFQLRPPSIPSKPGFEKPFEFEMPRRIQWHGDWIELESPKFKRGKLTLHTSEDPFNRYAENHAIDFFGAHTCVATYRMAEFGQFRHATAVEFLYGECHLPILEMKTLNCVRNDRQKLVENDLTEAVLDWVRTKIDEVGEKLEGAVQHELKSQNLAQSAVFNDYLNQWQKGFMNKFWTEIFGGSEGGAGDRSRVPSDSAPTATAEQSPPVDEKKTSESDAGRRRELGGGGDGNTPQRVSKFPQVLLSDFHPDPNDPQGKTLSLNPRHPPIYQRRVDQLAGIYWINTESPFAKEIQQTYGVDHTRWREYLFLRRIDIMIKQSIYQRARNEPKLTADIVDLTIDDVQRRVFEAAAGELKSYLFEPPTRIAKVSVPAE